MENNADILYTVVGLGVCLFWFFAVLFIAALSIKLLATALKWIFS